jgi:hypothetical protein
MRVALRPHPSEKVEAWRAWLGEHSGIEIVREGSAVPWILASKVLLHTNCTTGVEAIALDKPAICLIHPDSPANRRYLANRVNPVVTSTDTAIAVLERVLAVPESCYTPDLVERFKDSMSVNATELGAEQIINQVLALGEARGWRSHMAATSSWRPYKGYRWKQADKNVRGTLFPGLDIPAVAARIATLQQLLGLKQRIRLERCGAKLLLLTTRPLNPGTLVRRTLGALLPA